MAATVEQMRQGIEPGSIPYGQRQGLEQALGQLGGAQGGGLAPAAGSDLGAELGLPTNPLDPLLAGELDTGAGELTAGLSVGPGPGPVADALPDDRVQRLRLLATSAKSPVLREIARRSLRRLVGSDLVG